MNNGRLLPAKPFVGMTPDDLMLLEWPHLTEDDRWYFLWEATGWPCFFMPGATGWWQHELQRQMRDFREGRWTPDA